MDNLEENEENNNKDVEDKKDMEDGEDEAISELDKANFSTRTVPSTSSNKTMALVTASAVEINSCKTVKQLNGETLAGPVDKIDIDILMKRINRDTLSGTNWLENLIEKVFSRLTVITFAMSKLYNESISD
ncbi:hypothetical protein ACQJBY_072133 [Aegilops geniculata]